VDTKPELLLRSALHGLGYRFRKNYGVIAGRHRVRVDIAFPRERLAVFIDGCFWHQCPEHGSLPVVNQDYWSPKLAKNVERDVAVSAEVEAAGWTVLRLWEHEPRDEAVRIVVSTLEGLRADGKPTALDLFAGAGGSTQGLKAAGYHVLGAVENDKSAGRSYVANHKAVRLFQEDIRDVDPEALRATLHLEAGELDLLVACPPCQGFSTLGASLADDPRNDLVLLVHPFLKELRPKTFLLENVPGLRGDPRLEAVLDLARSAGYGIRSYVVNAIDFGVPQSRKRLIVVGVLELSDHDFPESLQELLPARFRRTPPAVVTVLDKAGPIETSRDAIHRARRNSQTVLARIQNVPPGGDRFDLPVTHQLDCHKGLRGRSASAAYGRIRADRPAPTMTTRCTTPACGRFVHPTEDRGISLREAALLQTFPLRYRFHGSYQSLEAQIGNAVPVRLARALGLAVKALLEKGPGHR
jgi:DNA (cytosine-5)-methyltransferase 1